MPIKEAVYKTDKNKAKVFTGGKPKDFVFTAASNGATVRGILGTVGMSYNLTTASTFDAKALYELADTLKELAGILDGTISA